ncbi:MAG: hypothetical protein Fur0025_26060 [Oscillatoriaceae cyanobacterium]
MFFKLAPLMFPNDEKPGRRGDSDPSADAQEGGRGDWGPSSSAQATPTALPQAQDSGGGRGPFG